MAHSSLISIDLAARLPEVQDVATLGTGENSDSGSDSAHVLPVQEERTAGERMHDDEDADLAFTDPDSRAIQTDNPDGLDPDLDDEMSGETTDATNIGDTVDLRHRPSGRSGA
jgi:hypothetical protein